MDTNKKVDEYLESLSGWKKERLMKLRSLIHEVAPNIQEDWKWEVPIFVGNKMICAISDFKDHVKINFFNGAKLSDPNKLFNSGLDSKKHRSINFSENDNLDESKVKQIISEAVALDSR